MSLAVVTEVANRFKTAVAKWQANSSDVLETRFLLHDGIYIGHFFKWGAYEGRWISQLSAIKIYRDGQWLMTVPIEIEIETVDARTKAPVVATTANPAQHNPIVSKGEPRRQAAA